MHGGVHPREVGAPHRPRAAFPWLVRASGGGAVWAAVKAHHLPQAAIVEGLQLCPLCLIDDNDDR